jgi:hypothetical protein
MKNKENKLWSGFLTNLLGVILGIILTFGGNALWQQREEKKKTKEMLILLRSELEINQGWFKNQEMYIKEDFYVYNKLLEANDKWRSIPGDTLKNYRDRLNSRTFSQLSTSAWQIFQSSEMVQKMTNKELLIMLVTCYNNINIIKEIIEKEYWDEKAKATKISESDLYQYFGAMMKNKESVYFFDQIIKSNILEVFPSMDAVIDYTLLVLDRDGYYQYDLDEMGKELDSFVGSRKDSLHQKNDTIIK